MKLPSFALSLVAAYVTTSYATTNLSPETRLDTRASFPGGSVLTFFRGLGQRSAFDYIKAFPDALEWTQKVVPGGGNLIDGAQRGTSGSDQPWWKVIIGEFLTGALDEKFDAGLAPGQRRPTQMELNAMSVTESMAWYFDRTPSQLMKDNDAKEPERAIRTRQQKIIRKLLPDRCVPSPRRISGLRPGLSESDRPPVPTECIGPMWSWCQARDKIGEKTFEGPRDFPYGCVGKPKDCPVQSCPDPTLGGQI
ncbi:hypothetical protein HIM_05624 [Hirsutella minnesotensis 3608]|uniref:Uncharacterized protein n=1 Tax=Hirsutella minnesotensis 3608 TaxID=1043627 RepID=A0A0F7ZUM8_9HYPO|nr:hypothetical protein HIM_05624 [Hirsutella minnesotensis 3608]